MQLSERFEKYRQCVATVLLQSRVKLLRIFLAGMVILLVLFTAASALMAYLFTRPAPGPVGSEKDLPFAAQPVEFRTSDGLLIRGWHAPSTGDSGTVLLLHGYTGNRTHMIPRAAMLREAGYGVLLYDARGCGRSDGNLISMGYHETADLLAALRYLRERGEKGVACIGVSQGGATIALAADSLKMLNVRAVICESTYDNLENAIDRRFRHYTLMPGWLGGALMRPFGEWRIGCDAGAVSPATSIAKLEVPLYIISGDSDTRVWTEDTHRLFAAARSPKYLWLIPGADHEDLHDYAPEEYRRRVLGFLREWLNK